MDAIIINKTAEYLVLDIEEHKHSYTTSKGFQVLSSSTDPGRTHVYEFCPGKGGWPIYCVTRIIWIK